MFSFRTTCILFTLLNSINWYHNQGRGPCNLGFLGPIGRKTYSLLATRSCLVIIIILLPTFFVQSFSVRPLYGSSWIFTIREDPKSTSKNKVFSAWKLVVSMETWKLRFSEHNFNCLVQGQFPTNFGMKCLNGRPWKNIPSMGTRSHVTSCYGNYEDFCWILQFGQLWTYDLRMSYQIFWIASW